jgi:hypothetical protein
MDRKFASVSFNCDESSSARLKIASPRIRQVRRNAENSPHSFQTPAAILSDERGFILELNAEAERPQLEHRERRKVSIEREDY